MQMNCMFCVELQNIYELKMKLKLANRRWAEEVVRGERNKRKQGPVEIDSDSRRNCGGLRPNDRCQQEDRSRYENYGKVIRNPVRNQLGRISRESLRGLNLAAHGVRRQIPGHLCFDGKYQRQKT